MIQKGVKVSRLSGAESVMGKKKRAHPTSKQCLRY